MAKRKKNTRTNQRGRGYHDYNKGGVKTSYIYLILKIVVLLLFMDVVAEQNKTGKRRGTNSIVALVSERETK